MARKLTDVLRRGEDEIHLTDVDGGALRTEHGIGRREVLPAVEQEPSIPWIMLLDETPGVLELRAALRLFQVPPEAFATRESLDRLLRHAHLDLALRAARLCNPRLRDFG